VSRRSAILELAVLGLLHDAPMHGYELRKQLSSVLGAFRVVSYGTLYPCLRSLLERGWIAEAGSAGPGAAQSDKSAGLGAGGGRGKRARIVYELTPEGKDQFQELLTRSGPAAWEDGTFDVHFAFFGRTDTDVRLRILEGRRSRLEERLDDLRASSRQRRERADAYTAELQRHGFDSTEREVRWLTELIETERSAHAAGASAADPAGSPATTRATDRHTSEANSPDSHLKE
jgi:DNA-binding PadR family transcriptional regulator